MKNLYFRVRVWYLEHRYPELAILPDGTVVRMRDGKVLGRQDPPN